MARSPWLCSALLLALLPAGGPRAASQGAPSVEPLLRELPLGVVVLRSDLVPAERTAEIGERLGAPLERLTNSWLQVYGRTVQVNLLTAADEDGAETLAAAIGSGKPFPYSGRRERLVFELVGDDVDEALARMTCWELGLAEKPARVRYRVSAELATIDDGDPMACNPLFEAFLALEQDPASGQALQSIDELRARFHFGRSLVLRRMPEAAEPASYRFEPPPVALEARRATEVRSFDDLARRHGVPWVAATLELTVDDSGLTADATATPEVLEALTAPTPYWPSDDPEVVALARRLTAGATDAEAKVNAILAWLAPNRNLRYEGRTGSRWGTSRVLEQGYGHCWDFSDVFVTLCRAAGVPCRQVAGWFYGLSGHVWAEYFRAGRGWQQVDPTGGGLLACGIYHVPYFTTEDGALPILYLSMPRIEVLETD